MTKPLLSDDDFECAAKELNCEVAAIKAVCKVEAPRGGFLDDNHPAILFERHIFSKRTGHKYDALHPNISNVKPGGYLGGMQEYSRFSIAKGLDDEAAKMSCSWGKFQLMGFNYYQCGYDDISGFLCAMYNSEQDHLNAFVAFLKNTDLDKKLSALDWAGFAKGYNGPNYSINQYDVKLKVAYESFKG